MEIRIMNMDDYKNVYTLWEKTPGMCMRNLDDSEDGISKFLKRNPDTNFVAVINNEIAGVILCGHDGRRASIYHAAVDSTFYGMGIGTRLVEAVCSALEKEGITKINILVLKDNLHGISFWKAQGFNDRNDILCFSKSLNLKND